MSVTARGNSRRRVFIAWLATKNLYTGPISTRSPGWRLHLQYDDGQIHLKDIIEGQKHDDVLPQIQANKIRYQPKQPGSK